MTPKEVVQAWHRTWITDPALANELYLDDDVKKLLPGTRAILGKQAASDSFVRIAEPLKRETYEPDTEYTVFICEGDKVAHRFRWQVELKDGRLSDMFVFNLYVVKNDKIVHFEEYFDTYERSKTRDITVGREGYDPAAWIIE